VFAAALDRHGLEYRRPDNLAEAAARLIADERIVGWFQGRLEFGSRALGKRSILASPLDPGMREAFRPFGAAVAVR